MSQEIRAEIAVLGGGLVGLAFANLLAARRPSLAGQLVVLDRAPPPVADGMGLRVSAWSPAAAALFAACDIWQELPADRVGTYRRMVVWRGEDPAGRESIHFDAADLGVAALGHIIDNDLLRQRLWLQAERRGVRLQVGAAPETLSIGPDEARLQLDDGRRLRARLLIGADGQASWLRRHGGLQQKSWSYRQQALVTHALSERPHRETAWQRFLADGPLALLPLADGRVSIVWSRPVPQAAELLALGQTEFAAELTTASGGVLGDLRPTVPPRGFPLAAAHAHRYIGSRVALIGDAAHQVHPLAGLGANLGLRDADCLAAELDAFLGRPEADPGDCRVLRRYERARKSDNLATLMTTDLLHRTFSAGPSALAALAGAGLGVVDRLPPVKRAFAAYAAGGVQRA